LVSNDGEKQSGIMILTNFFSAFGKRVNPGQFFFGGGQSAPSAPKPVKMPAAPQVTIPAPPPPPPPIPPAPTVSNLDASQAATDQKTQAARRKGVRSTLIAGESTGALSPATGSQNKTLLG